MPISIARPSEARAITLSVNGWESTDLFGEGNKGHPTCCAVGTLEAGVSSTLVYPYYTYAVVLEGEGQYVDASKPGETKTVATGDALHVEKGTNVTWVTTDKMKVFYVAAKELGDLNVGLVPS